MSFVLADRVKETTVTTGTGAVILAGAYTGFRTFSATVGNANTTYYCIADQGGANWEVGYGTYTAGSNSLSRDVVVASSNAGALTNFAVGVKDVFITLPATRAVSLDNSGNLAISGSITAASFSGAGTGLTGTASGLTAGAVSSITSSQVTTALGFTPYNSSNPSGYISGITSGMVTTALGYTPYNSTNPSGYISSITSGMVTTALGYTPYNSTNPSGYISGITSAMVTTALGYTPYNSTNPSGYITSSGSITGSSGSCTGNAATATTATTANALNTANGYTGQSFTATATNSGTFYGSGSTAGSAGVGLYVYTPSGSGAGAIMAFHRAGVYAVNMGLDSDNVLRIGGWSAAANRFQMDMSGNLTMAGNVTAYSDERLKNNWRPLQDDYLSELAQLKHGIYDRIDKEFDKTQVGVSAQGLRRFLPAAVLEDAEGILSVNYGGAALVSAVKLAEAFVAMREELAILRAEVAELKASR